MIRMAGSVSKSWLAQHLQVAFDRDYYFDLDRRHAIDVQCNRYVARNLPELDVFYTESNLGRRQWHTLAQVLVGGIQPNMIVGMLLGADFLARENADADISARCIEGLTVAELPAPRQLVARELIRRWDDDLTRLLASSEDVEPIAPFFWDRSGRAAVHGAVTSGLKFLGDEFLMKMLTQPGECEEIVNWLTEVNDTLVSHFADVGRQRVTSIHIGECAACMLDEPSFRRFVVPSASRLGARFGAVRFHSCGRSDHLLEACRAITGLAELDVGGETSVARIRQIFGPEFPVGIAPLVDDMRDGSTRGILDWFQRVRRENGDGDLTIGFHLEGDYRVENLSALHSAVRSDS